MKQDNTSPFFLDKERVRKHFDRAAATYDAHAIIQHEIARRFLERFDFIKFSPRNILDLGCGTGGLSKLLLKKFRKARLTALDLSPEMIRQFKQGIGILQRWSRTIHTVCGDIEALPFRDDAFDLITSNLTLQWCNNPDQVFDDIRRCLKPDGLLMFTTFGPDTMQEVRQAWQNVDNANHVNLFYDMHDIGDALMRAGFVDPVMDVERLTMTYESVEKLIQDIRKIGATNATQGASSGLMTKTRLRRFAQEYEKLRVNSTLPLTYEVVYGHAWYGAGQSCVTDGAIPVMFNPGETR